MMKVLAMAMLLVVLTTEASPPTLIQSPQAQSAGDHPVASAVERSTHLATDVAIVEAMASLIEALDGGLDQEKLEISKQYVENLKRVVFNY